MSRRKPVVKASAIERGMRRRLGADPAYSGLLIKNPMHPDWRVTWLHDKPYSLGELGEYLFPRDTRRDARREVRGLSRDCDTFDHTRFWAYEHVLRFKRSGGSRSEWIERCREVAADYNEANCSPPLTLREIRKIGKGIGGWTWRNFTEESRIGWLSRRGARRAAARWAGHVSAEKTKPWEAEGISRRTWYRRKAAARGAEQVPMQRGTMLLSDISPPAAGAAPQGKAARVLIASVPTLAARVAAQQQNTSYDWTHHRPSRRTWVGQP